MSVIYRNRNSSFCRFTGQGSYFFDQRGRNGSGSDRRNAVDLDNDTSVPGVFHPHERAFDTHEYAVLNPHLVAFRQRDLFGRKENHRFVDIGGHGNKIAHLGLGHRFADASHSAESAA